MAHAPPRMRSTLRFIQRRTMFWKSQRFVRELVAETDLVAHKGIDGADTLSLRQRPPAAIVDQGLKGRVFIVQYGGRLQQAVAVTSFPR